MIERVRSWVNNELDRAEQEKRCAVALARADRERFSHAATEGMARVVMPDLYVRPEYWEKLSATKRALHTMRTFALRRPNTVFAGPSAACAWGLAVSNRHLEHLWVTASKGVHLRESASFRAIVVTGDKTAEVAGVKVTSLYRTIADCLRIMDFRSGLAIADSALRLYGIDAASLPDRVAASCPRTSGVQRIRSVAAFADARAESGGESIARATMLELGFAMPDLQRSYGNPLDPSQDYFVDFSWKVKGGYIVGELDGFDKYSNPEILAGRSLAQVIEGEHRRQTHIETYDEVLRVIRFSFFDLLRERDFLNLLESCGVPRTYAWDERVLRAGGVLRCR